MKIYGNETNEIILKEIGKRIKSRRVSLAITQEEMSQESGVSLRTIVNIEGGRNVSFNNLISVLRVTKVSENLNLLVPESKTDPFDIIELGHKRSRVSKREETDKDSNWIWGDER